MSIEITAHELKEKIDNNDDFVIIDVREPYELEICRFENATYIKMSEVENHFDKMKKNAEYVVVCRSGARSLLIQFSMKNAGFTSVRNLKGGILSWIELIDPSMKRY